jgi:hypothetical protein
MRGRGRIWGVNERKRGYVDGGGKKKKKKKEWGTGTEGERGKKLRKEGILGVVKKNIY